MLLSDSECKKKQKYRCVLDCCLLITHATLALGDTVKSIVNMRTRVYARVYTYVCKTYNTGFSFSGLHTSDVAPEWALPHRSFMHRFGSRLISHNTVYDAYDLHHKDKSTTESDDLSSECSTELLQTIHNDSIVNSSALTGATNESLSRHEGKLPEEAHANSSSDYRKNLVERTLQFLGIDDQTVSLYSIARNKNKIPAEPRGEISSYHDETNISTSSSRASEHSTTGTSRDALRIVSDIIEQCEKTLDATSVSDDEPLDLVINPKRRAYSHSEESHAGEAKDRLDEYLSVIDKETFPVDGAVSRETNHSSDAHSCHNIKYKNYGLLQFSDLDKVSCNSDRGKELLKAVNNLHIDDEIDGKAVTEDELKPEKAYDILDKYVTHVLPSRLGDAKRKRSSWTRAQSSVKCNNIKEEYGIGEEAHKTESAVYNTRLNNWEYLEMSGQYPGHSRPPVGTPPPHTVWNHLTMTQGQGS